jgi:hypothetical protein
MVASLNQSTPARDTGYEGVQYICATLTMAAANLPVQKVGTIPAGAMVLSVNARITTVFAGGTPVLGVGSVAAGGAAPAVGASGNVFQPITSTPTQTSTTNVPSVTVAQPLAVDTDFYVGCTGGATSGAAVIAIAFIKPLA